MQFEHELKKDSSIIKLLSLTDLLNRIDVAFIGKYDSINPRISNYSEDKLSQLLMLGEMSNNEDIGNFTTDSKIRFR